MKERLYLAFAVTLGMVSACQKDPQSDNAKSVEKVGTAQEQSASTAKIDLAACEATAKGCVDGRLLHVESPDWRDQIIYFLMIDRFADGNPENNDQGVGVYDTSKESHYSGGDLQGIIDNLDYVKNLGATAIWTTPHVANMWWDPTTNYGGYHGYWARDFKAVDEHYGSLNDYKALSHALHNNGMFLVQDVVVNHVGNFFAYTGEYDPADVTKNFQLNDKAVPTNKPTQSPFDLVDVNNPEHRKADIYHWTPDIIDFSDPVQETTYQTGALSDLNTSNPRVIKTLKDSFGFWVEETGVDAIRIDTVKYVEKEFYEDFLHGTDGLYETAEKTGRSSFYSFGEVFNTSLPFSDKGEKKLAKYSTSKDKKKIDAPIGFPLYKEMNRVFAGGSPTRYLSYRLEAQMREYYKPYLVANFIDNHDVERFLASGSVEGFKLAYTLMLTVPGVPVIYQGDEQLFVDFRKAMFAGGYQSEKDHFDQSSTMYGFIQKLAKMRIENKLFSRGTIEILQDNPVGAGVFAFKREYEGKVGYVILNTSKEETLLNNIATPFAKGQAVPDILLQENYQQAGVTFDTNGYLTQILPANSALVFVGDAGEVNTNAASANKAITIDSIQDSYVDIASAMVKGRVEEPNAELVRIIDGDYGRALKFKADEKGHWEIDIPVNDLGDKEHYVEVFWPKQNQVSERKIYRVINNKAQFSVQVKDAIKDHKGLTGDYTIPTHSSMGCEMDIEQASMRAGGDVLELTLTMCSVSDVWTPPNQFDHVSFTTFFDIQDGGLSEFPVIGGRFPEGGAWDYVHMSYGWGNYLYSTNGASLSTEGEKLGLAPDIEVDKANRTVLFRYSAQAMGIDSWQGATVYITTWDKDGGGVYRNTAEKAGVWEFGVAGNGPEAPKILDAVTVKFKP